MSVTRKPNTPPGGNRHRGAAALYYSRNYNWPIFPVNTKKKPLVDKGFHAATTDPQTLRAWWREWPRANLAMPTGAATDIWVFDVDPRHGGNKSLKALEAKHSPIPETLRVRTGNGGTQFYFKYPSDAVVRNSVGIIGEGLDVRGSGGYVLLPPSKTTGEYSWTKAPITEAPGWLLELAVKATRTKPKPKPKSATSKPMLRTQDISADGPIHEGTRNNTLTSIGGALRAQGCSREEVETRLLAINASSCVTPLEDDEVLNVAASVCRYEPGDRIPRAPQEVLEVLQGIEAHWWARRWAGVGGRSDRCVFNALLRHAQLHGRLIPAGVSVSISMRALAEAAGVARRTVDKSVARMKVAGLIRRNGTTSGTKAGGLVLLSRARVGHSTTSVDTPQSQQRIPSGLPVRAPRFRWGTGRNGKTAQAVEDILGAGPATCAELAEVLQTRARDLRRRTLAKMLGRGLVVECAEDTYRLADGYDTVRAHERELSGEAAADKEDRKRHEKERRRWERWLEMTPKQRKEAKKCDRAPTTAEMDAKRAEGEISELEPVNPGDRFGGLDELYSRINLTVQTPRGPGRLCQVRSDKAGVILESDPSRVLYVPLSDVGPPDDEYRLVQEGL